MTSSRRMRQCTKALLCDVAKRNRNYSPCAFNHNHLVTIQATCNASKFPVKIRMVTPDPIHPDLNHAPQIKKIHAPTPTHTHLPSHTHAHAGRHQSVFRVKYASKKKDNVAVDKRSTCSCFCSDLVAAQWPYRSHVEWGGEKTPHNGAHAWHIACNQRPQQQHHDGLPHMAMHVHTSLCRLTMHVLLLSPPALLFIREGRLQSNPKFFSS